MKKYSFVICTYNNMELLRNTLQSLNNQKGHTGGDYEAVVVDDGSGCSTWDGIKGINKTYELKYLYIERDAGSCLSRARNRGWKAAEGEIIVFIDADIIVKDTYISELDRYYNADNRLIVAGMRLMLPRGVIISSDTLFQNYSFQPGRFELFEIRHFIFDYLSYNMPAIRYPWALLYGCNIAVPKAYLQALGGFDENFKGWGVEDLDFGLRLYRHGAKIVVNSRLEVLHQYHSFNRSRKDSECTKNTRYFLKKHSGTLDYLSLDEALKIGAPLFIPRSEYIQRFGAGAGSRLQKVTLDFKETRELDALKDTVSRLSCEEGLEITVNDYLENGELDVFLQLLGPGRSTPKYYPSSRKLKNFRVSEIRQYISKCLI